MVAFRWEALPRSSFGPSWVILYVDDEEWKKVSRSMFPERALASLSSEAASMESLSKKFFELECSSAFSLLLRHLAKRALTEHEASALLLRHRASKEAVAEAIIRAQQSGYIQDSDLLVSMSQRLLGQKKSLRAIREKVQSRFGASFQPQFECEASDQETLLALIQKKFMKEWTLAQDDPKLMQKLISKLCRRGFSYETVISAFRRL